MRPCPRASPALIPVPPSQPLQSPAPVPRSLLTSCQDPHGGSRASMAAPPLPQTGSPRPLQPRVTLETGSGALGPLGTGAPEPAASAPGELVAPAGQQLAPGHRSAPHGVPCTVAGLDAPHQRRPPPPSWLPRCNSKSVSAAGPFLSANRQGTQPRPPLLPESLAAGMGTCLAVFILTVILL